MRASRCLAADRQPPARVAALRQAEMSLCARDPPWALLSPLMSDGVCVHQYGPCDRTSPNSAASQRSEEDWGKLLAEAHQEYDSGAFVLERLGAERYLDPKLMATLLKQRQSIIAEWGITTAAETMLVDLAVVHYALVLRVHGWIGDLAVRIESEFFGDDAFTEVVKGQRRIADRFAVAERVQRLSEQLMPTLDRANRMMIRNLKAIKELRQGQVPAITIGRAEQVTVTNRPPRRLRPLKGVALQPDVTTAVITSGSDARSAVDGVVLVPSGKRRASQRERSVARSPQTPPRRGTRLKLH
jgi:hypothetical protein